VLNPWIYAGAFTFGVIVVTYLLFLLLGQRNMKARGELADIRFVTLALVLIVSTGLTLASLLILGKM
jgi:hypothetical protein